MFENDECMQDMLKFMDFIHKREDVKPILKQIDDAFENSQSEEDALDRIDEVLHNYFGVKSNDEFMLLNEEKSEELDYFSIYIESLFYN
jgi:hypothetical protein